MTRPGLCKVALEMHSFHQAGISSLLSAPHGCLALLSAEGLSPSGGLVVGAHHGGSHVNEDSM